jgi:hypothetical protein
MTRRTLGFSTLNASQSDLEREPTDVAIDRIAKTLGFTSREPVEKLSKRDASNEPTANLVLRPRVSVFNRFVQFSKDNRYSYPEALEVLMNKAGI